MMLLLTFFLLIFQTGDFPAAKLSAVEFVVVKQGPIKDQGCFDFYHRRITFRVKNRSDKSIYIHGLKSESRHPFGYLIRLDGEKNQWINPEGNTPRTWKEFLEPIQHFYERDVYVVPPGKSMKFETLAGEKYRGGRIKRGIFMSSSQDEEPQMVTSEEFILR